jgi:spore germination cell wall hydrolase CwlJ-like protein
MMTLQDQVIGALTAWRENRGGGTLGMQSVINVLQNRAAKRGTSVYEEAVRKWQFSSMTAPGDPNLILYPTLHASTSTDYLAWEEAQKLATQAAEGTLADLTGGATSYYAQSMATPPSWTSTMKQTCIISNQIFFK